MALKFIDSFDHYATADINLKWTSTLFATRDTGIHGYGVRGTLSKGMLFGSTTIIMEAFIKRMNSGGASLFGIGDTNSTSQIGCDYSPLGQIEVSRYGSNPATDRIFQSAPDLIRVGTWYHFAWTVFLHPTAGTLEVRLNGATVCNLTGIQTTATSLPWSGAVGSFNLGDNGSACIFDDLVVMDNVDDGINDARLPGGGGFDKFLGPVEIVVKHANGAGLVAEWTPTPTVPNWQNVDDPTPDADATFNGALPTAVGASDLFAMEDLAADEDVVAVQSLVLARKTQEGVAAIAKLTRDGVTTSVGPTLYQPSTYSYMHAPEPTLPDGSTWTKARWNAIQYGYRRIV
jgi:hypothetical protein